MKSKYKDLKFKSKEEFEEWLKTLTKYHIFFEYKGQDFVEWFIDKNGEILHSDMQAWVWNGKMLDVKTLKVGKCPKFTDGKQLNYKIVTIRKIK